MMKNIFITLSMLFSIIACDNERMPKHNKLSDYIGQFTDSKQPGNIDLRINTIEEEYGNGLYIYKFDSNIKMMCTNKKIQTTINYLFKEEYHTTILECMADDLSVQNEDFFHIYVALLKLDDNSLIFLLTNDKNNFDKDYCHKNQECQIYRNLYNKI